MTHPFSEDAMMLIMDLKPPSAPGMHGETTAKGCLDPEAIKLISEIKGICEAYLSNCGECPKEDKPKETDENQEEV